MKRKPRPAYKKLDRGKPIIVLDHQPKDLEELSAAGTDLDLCGHTHNGQIFPGNIFTRFLWENSWGYLRKGSMHNIVTSGVGVCDHPCASAQTAKSVSSRWSFLSPTLHPEKHSFRKSPGLKYAVSVLFFCLRSTFSVFCWNGVPVSFCIRKNILILIH